MSDRKPGPKPKLTREALVAAALSIVDSDGLDALSMRRLGTELGVDPMAAYRHFPNKEALLDGVVEAVVAEVDLDTDPLAPWSDQVRALSRAYRAAILAHPATAPLIASRPLATPGALRVAERSLELLEAGGVSPTDAFAAVNVIGIFIAGLVLVETGATVESDARQLEAISSLPREDFPRLLGLVATGDIAGTYDAALDFGLDAVIGRLERELAKG